MHDVEPLEGQIGQGYLHGLRNAGSIAVLELEAVALAAPQYQEVELRARVRSIEERIALSAQQANRLLEREALPRGAELGMRQHITATPHAEEQMQQARITQVDARRLDQALP